MRRMTSHGWASRSMGPNSTAPSRSRPSSSSSSPRFRTSGGRKSTTHPQVTHVPRLYSNDASKPATVGVQTPSGAAREPWFQDGRYSATLRVSSQATRRQRRRLSRSSPSAAKSRRCIPVCHSIWIAIARCAKCRRIDHHADFDTDMRLLLKNIHHMVMAAGPRRD